MASLTRKHNRKLLIEQEKRRVQVESLMKRKMIRKHYFNKFNIKVSHKNFLKLDENKLHEYFIQKQRSKLMNKSAKKIQTAYRRFIARKKYLEHLELINSSATRLQNCWRAYRRRSLLPKAWKKFKYNRITRIQ